MPDEYTESPRLERMLEAIPPFYRRDPTVRGILNAEAKEIDRLEAAIDEVQRIPFPLETSTFLSLWEQFFGLPIEPEGVSLAKRQSLIALEFRRIAMMTFGSTWVERMDEVIGGKWSHEEDEGILNIVVPFGENSGRVRFLATYARTITPANLEIHIFFEEGFILGISQLGVSQFR